jgi:hypothetical protein
MPLTCPKCGAILPGRFCSACGTDSERPFLQRIKSRLSMGLYWAGRYPRFAILAIILFIGGIYGVLDSNVDFIERHLPKLNAMLHKGAISSDGDALYAFDKWMDDVDHLNADYKQTDWKGWCKEALSRKPFLDDLIVRDDAIQSLAASENISKDKPNDACEQLFIHEGAPRMERYTKSFSGIYSLLAQGTEADKDKWQAAFSEYKEARQSLSDYITRYDSRGCVGQR